MDAARGNGAGRDAAAGHTVVVIPTLDEEQSIAEVVRSIPRTIASRVIVADGGSCDATVARAKAAGAIVGPGAWPLQPHKFTFMPGENSRTTGSATRILDPLLPDRGKHGPAIEGKRRNVRHYNDS